MRIIPKIIVNPSYLIKQNTPANANDSNIDLFCSLKKSDMCIKMHWNLMIITLFPDQNTWKNSKIQMSEFQKII